MKFIHTDGKGNVTTNRDRSTGCTLANPPRHKGGRVKWRPRTVWSGLGEPGTYRGHLKALHPATKAGGKK